MFARSFRHFSVITTHDMYPIVGHATPVEGNWGLVSRPTALYCGLSSLYGCRIGGFYAQLRRDA
jgi:hypothetical protein